MSVCRSVGEFLENYFKNGESFKQISFEDKTLYKSLFEVAMDNKNDKDFQCLLGDIHSTYISGFQDPKLSFEFYVKAANQNHPKAMYSVGLCYYNGKGVIKDYQRAIYWFTKASSLGYHDSLIYLGLCNFKGLGVEVNYSKAFSIFEDAARHNLKEAFYYLGICYRSGIGAQENLKTAFEYTLKGAELGDVNSMYNIAYSYDKGEGVEQDYENAAKWYAKAATGGNAQAMYNLGCYYDQGKGVPQDYSQAILYFAKASQKNFDKAMYRLALYYENGIGVDKDISVAFHFYNEGAKLGNKNCLNNLALYYQNGKSCDSDIEKSIHYYEEASKKGNELAMYNLASMYELGVLVKQNYKLAYDYYLQASIKGHAKSLYKLGVFYLNGLGVNQNYQEAISCLKKASDLNDVNAQYELGLIHQLGKGVPVDNYEAKKWFDLAKDNGNAIAYINLVAMLDNKINKNIEPLEEIVSMPQEPTNDFEILEIKEVISSTLETLEHDKNENDSNDENLEDFGFKNSLLLTKISSLVAENSEYSLLLEEYKNFTSKTSKNTENIFNTESEIKELTANQTPDTPLSEDDENRLSNLNNLLDNLVNERRDIEESITVIEKRFRELEHERIEKERWQAYLKDVNDYFDKLRKKLANNSSPLDNYNVEELITEYEYLDNASKLGYPNLETKIEYINYLLSKEKANLHISQRNDVFICYCDKDREIQDRIHLILESRNICTIWEKTGSDTVLIDDEILDAIEHAKLIIPIISANSLQSDLVRRELVAVFDRLDNTIEPNKLIRPVFVNVYSNENSNIETNVFDEISKLDDRSIFKRLYRFSEGIDVTLDYEQIYIDAKTVLDDWMISEYKNLASQIYSNFNFAVNKLSRSLDTKNGIVSSNVSLKDSYIDRVVYDKKHSAVSSQDILDDKKDILIYGRRGIGKSLYLMNMFTSIVDNNVFFVSCKDAIDDMECERSFDEILKNNAFDIYFDKLKISSSVFDAYISVLNNIVIFIDGLDEINSSNKEHLLSSIGQFINKQGKKEIKLIYSSRELSDSDLIHKYTKSTVVSYSLELFTEDDVLRIFDNINEKYQLNLISNVEVSDSVSREFFKKSIDKINDHIKYNPLLISNIIYSYFVTKKIMIRKFDIIKDCINLLCDNLLNNTPLGYKYSEYSNHKVIGDLLQVIAFENAKGNSRSNHLKTTIVKYYEKLGINNHSYISDLVFNELNKLGIINKNGINNLLLRDYLVASYLYNFIFTYDEEFGGIAFKIDSKQLKDIFNKYSENNEEWSSISAFLLAKIDSEVKTINNSNEMSQTNKSYSAFDMILTYAIKKKVFDKNALVVIKEMCDNNELYYSEFIKSYF